MRQGEMEVKLGRVRLAWVLFWLLVASQPAWSETPFLPLYPDPALFTTALARCRKLPAIPWRVTGLTVPHHLLAVDLLAEGFTRLAGQDYRRIIILCPDHYNRAKAPAAVAARDFDTCLGPVATDTEAVARLRACPLIEISNLFTQEHGIQALTPFLARFFPRARLVAMACWAARAGSPRGRRAPGSNSNCKRASPGRQTARTARLPRRHGRLCPAIQAARA